ncbi:MAG: dihydrolipoyl dehydrogenase [Alphaproteobacteria bacterium]|nr:dihydrolipoyl dehydrogenase [Alphaproteobacteria bacterium]
MGIQKFDIVIIGAGPAGYVCAIRASQLGLNVACIDSRPTLGGTCLNVGCIPSKALLISSHKFSEAKEHFAKHGIQTGEMTLDLATMQARQAKWVEDLTKGITYLFKKNKITFFEGQASFLGQAKVLIQLNDGHTQQVEAKHIIVATGSVPTELLGIDIDEQQIVSSTGVLSLKKVPEHLVVIGGGYIGLEMGSVWQRLGARVTVVEFLDKIIPAMDHGMGQTLYKQLSKQGLGFKLETKVTGVKKTSKGVTLFLEGIKDRQKSELSCDVVLVAAGRKPLTAGLGLEDIGVKLSPQGHIVVNQRFETNVSGVYAIGDVIPGPMLAHKAEEEGIVLAELLAGQGGEVNYGAIPAVIYTQPEVASVGKTEEELKASGIEYKVGLFPLTASSRAKANGQTEGFVKVLAGTNNDKVLGVHIIAPEAGTMIAEAVLAMEFSASSEDIARTCHAHPTLNEAFKEAALAVTGHAIHI